MWFGGEIISYQINRSTMLIMPISSFESKVLEMNNEFIIKENSFKIIKDSCKYFGSSYIGRCEGSKYILNSSMKLPVVIEESNDIIFFPTSSSKQLNCIWINYDYIKKIEIIDSKNSMIIFKNDKKFIIGISYYVLDNQLIRCMKLKLYLMERKKELCFR